jgi:hypothetical protein
MPWIPHSFASAIAPLTALVVALALPLAARGKSWAAAAGPLALFVGWALLEPVTQLPRAVWAPHRGPEALLAPALACVAGVAVVAWRGGRQERVVAVLMAVFAGWWVARDGVNATDFWRVWFGIAALAAVLSRVLRGRTDRLLVLAVALWGGLEVAGAGPVWALAALVAAACAAGLVAAGAQISVSSTAIAALIGATEIAGGRLLQYRFDMVDAAFVAALAAPFIADASATRLPRRIAPVFSRALGAVGAVAAVWLVRRAFFT